MPSAPGQIVILNGVPRAGKTSIVHAIQERFAGPWLNLGVDVHGRLITPERYWPGVGLRPGEPQHPVWPLVPRLLAALYDSIAAHSRQGFNVVTDIGHHDMEGRGLLSDCARRLDGLPVLFVGVRCPIEVIMQRRRDSQSGRYVTSAAGEPIPEPVLRFQREVHRPGIYDLELDTSKLSPEECADAIRRRLDDGPPPSAFGRVAAMNEPDVSI